MTALEKWWQKPLRVIQTNLQVKDTQLIDPSSLAENIAELGGNALCFNVGGIYAWYDTSIPYHVKNPFLPKERELLKEVIEECHKHDIRFLARFDFSKAEDSVYLHRPQWFVKDQSGEPDVKGALRPGEWPLLMSTCVNGHYRSDAAAIPILHEVMDNFNIDGIFLNNPGYVKCFCEDCKRKYKETYDMELPETSEKFMPDWGAVSFRDNISKLYQAIKGRNSEIPLILYYGLYEGHLAFEKVSVSSKVCDMLCTEAQNVLSRGRQKIPGIWDPTISVKVGRGIENKPDPFCIIHSSPGMDWRHTGLPGHEYAFWLSQVPANGGNTWHSLTGIPETIGDRRILETISKSNRFIKKVEPYMEGTITASDVLALWDGSPASRTLASGLASRQVIFDMLHFELMTYEKLKKYKAVIIPEGWDYSEEFTGIMERYVKEGGRILAEGIIPDSNKKLLEILGITGDVYLSQELSAAYIRLEPGNNPWKAGLEETELIPFRGRVLYSDTLECAKTYATLVPPFAPLDSVGAPPERASLPVSHTDIPMCICSSYGKGEAVYLPFSLSGLLNEFGLEDHYTLLSNITDFLLKGDQPIKVQFIQGLMVNVFCSRERILVFMVNGVGTRPLQSNVPLYGIEASVKIPEGKKAVEAKLLIAEESLCFSESQQQIKLIVPRLNVFECVVIELKDFQQSLY